jgi:hypothetical protein
VSYLLQVLLGGRRRGNGRCREKRSELTDVVVVTRESVEKIQSEGCLDGDAE